MLSSWFLRMYAEIGSPRATCHSLSSGTRLEELKDTADWLWDCVVVFLEKKQENLISKTRQKRTENVTCQIEKKIVYYILCATKSFPSSFFCQIPRDSMDKGCITNCIYIIVLYRYVSQHEQHGMTY